MKSLQEADLVGKRVLVRADFDVPVENFKVQETLRIEKTIPTLKKVIQEAKEIFIISHLGRPENKDPDQSLRIVLPVLEDLLEQKVAFQENLEITPTGKITLLENLRYWSQEEDNDEDFAKALAKFGDIYVNECFSAAHRKHASVYALAKMLPSFAGLELFKEITELEQIFKNPQRPLLAIIGGAKIETKLPAITNMSKVADKVLVGGKLMFEIEKNKVPENVMVAVDSVDQKDVGEETLKIFGEEIKKAKMIVWNGTMGMYEEEKYEVGTRRIAKMIGESSAYSIVGGGDTTAALDKEGMLGNINFVSVGGGAMLEFLEGKKLPALEALGYYND